MKTHLTYIIYSEVKDQYYIGSSSVDISLRLERHNQGWTRSTKSLHYFLFNIISRMALL